MTETLPLGTALIHEDRRIGKWSDGHDEAIDAFRDRANAPKNRNSEMRLSK